jgi:hypothetical protein
MKRSTGARTLAFDLRLRLDVCGLGDQQNAFFGNRGAVRRVGWLRGIAGASFRALRCALYRTKRGRPRYRFGPPASTFKMNSGDTSYIWQLGNQTNAVGGNGAAVASTSFCKVSVVASKAGIVTLLNTEDSNAGGGIGGAIGMYGSICAHRLGIQRS